MVARGWRLCGTHRHQVRRKFKSVTLLSNSHVPGLERLFRRQVFSMAWQSSVSTRSSDPRPFRLDASQLTKSRTASHALLRLFVGSPQTLATTNQCCTNAASSRAHTRITWRTAVEPLSTATRSCDFQRLNSSSTCHRAPYITAASCGVSLSGGTLVTKMVQSHHARCSAQGSCPRLLTTS